INESEKSFLSSYFQIYLFDKLNSSPVNQFNIAIVDKNKKEAVEILPLIQERFNRINATDYFRNVSEMPFNKNYDLILTTEPIHSNNVLYIPSGFYNKKLIRKELDDFYFKQSVFKKDKSLKSLIFTELRENNFYIGQSKDYETNLVRMLEYLEKIEIVDEDFTNAILLRESESSTKFSDQLAFPHVKSNEFILSLGLFPNSQIKVIIIVGIPSDDDTLIINLYDEIVTLATDNDFLNNVYKVKDYRQLMEFIIKDTKLFR
ncbi:MAG: PTS sugar transporter subunit IIA, partial [Anaerococcus sp.]|nr:PTS sugar transporter subunit IIA [Anaerococcus sp.]